MGLWEERTGSRPRPSNLQSGPASIKSRRAVRPREALDKPHNQASVARAISVEIVTWAYELIVGFLVEGLHFLLPMGPDGRPRKAHGALEYDRDKADLFIKAFCRESC